uniref:Poly [ADP-ribose] polymerase n=1 Tax=Arion vulgaris TaxID=1028688 RepID=A0A0B7ABP7_9EUPU
MGRTKRTPRTRTADLDSGDAPEEKKIKLESPKIDDFEVQFQWEGDKSKWVLFTKKFNEVLLREYNAGKKQVELDVPNGATLVIIFDKMVQKNKKTGFERRIRAALKNDKNTDFNILEWQEDSSTWTPYSVKMSVELEKAFESGSKLVTIKSPPNTYEIDLKKLTQTNIKTKFSRSFRREIPVSDVPPDYEDNEENNAEEEEQEKEVKKSGRGKGRSGGKSKKTTTSGEGTSKSTVRTVVVKRGSTPVDDQCPVANKCGVYESGKIVWDCMLNQTNIANNNNKYYLIQLLQESGKSGYYVWQRWGRVGYKGQTNLLNCSADLNQATNAFTKKFRDKTGNDWSAKDHFVKVAGKYDLLKMDYSAKEDEDEVDTPEAKNKIENDEEKAPDSKLEKRVQELIQLICDVKSMEDAVMEMKYDAKKAPLGKLTKQQIKAGYEALKNIESLIDKKDFGRNLSDACSDFYTRIPHEFGMQAPPLIRSPQMVKEKIALLEALEDIEIAIKMLKGGDMSENPIDRHYHQLHCGLTTVDHVSEEFKLIDKYLKQTHASTHNQYKMELIDVFVCDKEGEDANFQDYGNRMLLWHGSRLTNWAGILGQGLRIAPPEAPVTGYMFGKGVYFADMSSKSANYCFATKTKNTGLLALCDVSLGSMNDKLAADYSADKLPKGKHSTRGVGKIAPDPSANVTLPDGLIVPVGQGKDTGTINPSGFTLNYNEYIVYDVRQIRMKYLVNVKFHFK